MKRCFIFLLLQLSVSYAYAQEAKVVIRFLDATNAEPVNNVAILNKNGRQIAATDSSGYCAVSFGNINSAGYLLAIHAGYSTDTIFTPGAVIYLQPLSVTMSTTIIRGNKVGKLLHEPDEYVVDYIFAGDNILVAAYSGNSGKNARLLLLNKEGDILAKCKIPYEPVGLFKSCVGNYYCVCDEVFYPVSVSGDGIALKTPYKTNLLPGLMQCEQSINGNLFYRRGDRNNFRMSYGMLVKGDSAYKPLVQFDEREVARVSFLENDVANASFEEYEELTRLWESGNYRESYRRLLLRDVWDNGSYAHINIPLFSSGDSLVIFDYFRKRILYYNCSGRPIGQTPIQFEWKQSQQFEIIKDEAQNRFYIHRYDNKGNQFIEELDITTGVMVSCRIPINKRFPEHVKVENGDIYFLWQDSRAGGTRQLYVQHEDLSSSMSAK